MLNSLDLIVALQADFVEGVRILEPLSARVVACLLRTSPQKTKLIVWVSKQNMKVNIIIFAQNNLSHGHHNYFEHNLVI